MSPRSLIFFCCLLQTGFTQSDQDEPHTKTTQRQMDIITTTATRNISAKIEADIMYEEADFSFTCHEGLDLLRFTSTGVIAIILAAVGLVSNSLLFVVVYKQKYNQSTNLIIRVLAVVDSFILIICVVAHSIRIITSCGMKWHFYQRNHQLIFAVFYPIAYCTRTLSIWLTTLLAIDRWQAMSHCPSGESRKAKLSFISKLICVICGAVIVSLPRFFEYRLEQGRYLEEARMTNNQLYTIMYKIILFFLSTYLIPMILMILFNIKLILILRHGQTDTKKSRSITLTVVVIVLIFIACNIPPMISHLIWSLETAFPSMAHLEKHRRPMTNITNILVAFYCVVNFFVYFFCSKSFRSSTANLCGCKNEARSMGNSQSSMTNLSRSASSEKLNQDTKI